MEAEELGAGHCSSPCPPSWRLRTKGFFLFFYLFITHVRPIQIMARICTVRFLSAVRAVAARCKHPFCPPPRPVLRTFGAHQGNYKRKDKRRRASV